jgi:hypothetical protein
MIDGDGGPDLDALCVGAAEAGTVALWGESGSNLVQEA